MFTNLNKVLAELVKRANASILYGMDNLDNPEEYWKSVGRTDGLQEAFELLAKEILKRKE